MKKRIIAWIMIFTMIFGSNAFTVFAETMSEESQMTSDVSATDLQGMQMVGANVVSDDESKPVSSSEEMTASTAETSVAPSDLTMETAATQPTHAEEDQTSDAVLTQGYIRLPAGAVIYASVKMKTELGKTDASAIVYAEATSADDASDIIYKVVFDTEDGSSYEGYVSGKELELLSKDEAGSLSGSRQYNGFLIPVILVTFKDNTLTDGLWIYDVVDGYARVLGYQDYKATDLFIPDQLGGYYVNAIGNKAFVKNTVLASLYVHGNVISIADNAFAGKDVVLSGYNGTQVLTYATAHGMKCKNRTAIDGIVLQDHVVDFSYADGSRYEYKGEYSITMNAAEAAQLSEGSIIYLPERYGELIAVYKVQSVTSTGNWRIVKVTEASAEESLERMTVSDESLYANWENAEWADGVELIEEKLDAHFSHGGSIYFKVKKDLDKAGELNFTVSGNLEGKVDFDMKFLPLALEELSVVITPSFTIKGAYEIGHDFGDENKQLERRKKLRELTHVTSQEINGAETVTDIKYELYLGKVPLISAAGLASVTAGMYLECNLTGEASITFKVTGKLGVKWDKANKKFVGVHEFTPKPPEVSIEGTLEVGPKEELSVEFAIVGKTLSAEMFNGLVLTASWTPTSHIECMDVSVGWKVNCSAKITLEVLEKIAKKTNTKIEIGRSVKLFELTGNLKPLHIEWGRGIMQRCSYEDKCNVSFNTGTATKLESKLVDYNTKITEPDLTINGQSPEGWFTDKAFKNQWDFSNGKVTQDMTLYAKWNMITHEVIYHQGVIDPDHNLNESTEIRENAMEGQKISQIENPMHPNYVFRYWYKKESGNEVQWDFNTGVMPAGDLELWAKWEYQEGHDPYVINTGGTGGNDVTHGLGYDVECNGHKYKHIMTYLTYDEAAQYAKDHGGYLMTITSKQEQDIIARYVNYDCAQEFLWLGIRSGGNWQRWNTGEDVIYSNWETGFPTTSSSAYNGVIRRTTGKWETLSNSSTSHFVIEWGGYSVGAGAQISTGVTYTKSKNSAKATGYNGSEADLVIDEYFEGLPVTEIENSAFKGNTNLTSIVLPSQLKKIGHDTFNGCTKLKEITIPDSVEEVGSACFYNCTSLQNIKWSTNVKTIDASTFYGNTNLTRISNIESVTSIKNNAFYNCSKLVNFVFPAQLSSIGQNAFYACGSLPDIIMPDTVTEMGSGAFQNCSGAKAIIVSGGLKELSSNVFSGCSNVTDIYIPQTILTVPDNALNSVNGTYHVYQGSDAYKWAAKKNKTIDKLGASYRVNFVTYSDGNSASGIKDGSQSDNMYIAVGSRITEPAVEMDGKVIEGWYLDSDFTHKWDFASDKMPESNITLYAKWVETTEAFDFQVINDTVKITGYNGNNYSVVIPDKLKGYTVTSISQKAITGNSIRVLTIPATVQTIESGAFDCPNLTTIHLASTKYFKTDSFGVLYNASGKNLIYVPQGTKLMRYEVPDGTVKILSRAFVDQNLLSQVMIPDSVTTIVSDAFEGLPFVVLYGSVNDCAAKTFAQKYFYAYNEYKVYYYNGTEMLYDATISAGDLISDYYRPISDFEKFAGWYKDEAFTQPWDFEHDSMPEENINLYLKWESLFSVEVSNASVTITGYNGSDSDIVIPSQISGYPVTGIALNAFKRASYNSVTIPDSVVTIEQGAFADHIKLIGSEESKAYEYCMNYGNTFALRKYTIHFEEYGGSKVNDLSVVPGETVKLPMPVRDNYIFGGWFTDTGYDTQWTDSSVMPENDITLHAQWKITSNNVLDGIDYTILEDGTIKINSYTGDKTVLTIPQTISGYTVSEIGAYAFYNNDTILRITLPTTVTKIGEYAFAGSAIRSVKGFKNVSHIGNAAFMSCTGLNSFDSMESLEIIEKNALSRTGLTEFNAPQTLLSIGENAFYDCEFIDEVELNAGLTSLGKGAFVQCPRLLNAKVPDYVKKTSSIAFDASCQLTYTDSSNITVLSYTVDNDVYVTLTWNGVSGAYQYALARKSDTVTKLTRWNKYYTAETRQVTVKAGNIGETVEIYVLVCNENKKAVLKSEPVTVYLSTIDTPSIDSVTQTGSQTANMTIQQVNGADAYEIERTNEPDGQFKLLKSVTSVSFTNSGLMPGQDYYYRVRAYKTENGVRIYSRYSDLYYFHMPYKYVTAPENVRVVQTAANASTIFWNYVNEADGYIVYRSVNGAAFKQLRQTYNNSTINMSLPEGGTFAYKVCAYFNEGDTQVLGPVSETVTLVLGSVATPIIQSIMQHSATGVSLKWTSVKGASGYKLYMATSEDGPYTWVKNLGNVTASTMASKMSAGNTYYFKIRAFVNNLDSTVDYSDYSLPVSIDFSSVPKITGLTAVQNGSNKAKLTWTAISEIEKYEVWVSAVNDQNYELVTTTTARTATIENLNDGVDYFFKVRGCNGEGNSKVTGEYSDAVSVSILGAPELQVAEQCGTTSVQLIWSKVGSADGYEIWRKTSSEDYKLAKTVEVNSAQVFGLEVGSTYGFKVRPYKLDESGSKQYGYYSNVISVYIIGTTKISSLVRNGGSSVQLTWSKATGATGYALYRSDSINGVFKKVKTTTALSISNSGLTKGEAYYFRIVPYRTVNGVDIEGRPTAVKGIRMLDKPVITSIEQTASKTLTLTWTEVPMAAFYRIYRSEGQNGEFTLLKKVTDSTTATSVNLTQDKWYYYTVEAGIDEDNTTYYSLQSNASGSYVTSMEKTEISTSVQTSPTSVTVSWKKVSGASGYELLRSSSEDGEYTSLKILTATSFTDKELTQGQTYYYKVRPYKVVSGISVFGMKSNAAGIRMLGAVNLTALERTASKRVDLYWEPVANASSYMIFRSDSKDGTYAFLKGTTDTTAYNTALTLGATYYYKVAAVISDGTVTNIGPQSSALGITLYDIGSTSVTSVKQTKSATVELEWKAVSNVEGYELSMASEGNTVFSKVKNSVSTKTSTTLNLTDNRTFRYRVRAYITVDGKKEYGPYSQPVSITLMSAPALNALYQTASNSVQMTWTEASSVDGYEVYRKEANGSFAKIKTVTELSVDNKALTIGTKYTYKIRAYRTLDGITSYSGYSNEMSITPIRYTKGNYPESAHDYSNNMNQSWTYSIDGAKALRVKFVAETNFENSYDKLYITDKDGNSVGNSYWTGTQLSSKTLIVPGNTINLRMTTDGSVVRYGFAIESITPAGQ